jgi:hypothetical protein
MKSSLKEMSKSECEAVAFYKKIFSYYRIYKYRYDWDEKKRVIVEVRSGSRRNGLLHRFHIPVAFNLFIVLLISYDILHRHSFATNEIEISFVRKLLQFALIGDQLLEAYVYWLFFMAFPEQIIGGMNRLLVYNHNISKFIFRLLILMFSSK